MSLLVSCINAMILVMIILLVIHSPTYLDPIENPNVVLEKKLSLPL
jgi:hypothetical protein